MANIGFNHSHLRGRQQHCVFTQPGSVADITRTRVNVPLYPQKADIYIGAMIASASGHKETEAMCEAQRHCTGPARHEFNRLAKLICPTSEVCEFLSSPFAKNNLLPFFRNSCFLPGVSPRQEGRTRRHEREAGCDGRGLTSVRRMMLAADGEGVWSWRPLAGAKPATGDGD